ncbi:hypothetical protein QCA50_010582 [Cerrena zonata]|uniref:Protein kinase domain-containing protein n=1 Tax=Cerrena zonata TaxID=2478898 RepID=A0AAW0G8Q9_9APHY
MELIGPDLHDFKDLMASKGYRTSIVDLQSIAYQLTDALRFMHDYKIIHADIKLVNIGLLSGDWYEDFAEAEERKLRKVAKLVNNQVRIFDLSLMEASVGPHRKRCGTRGFDPPEVVLDMAWSTPRDVWSLGMSLLIWYDCRPGNPFDLYELDRRFTPRETLIMWTNILLHPMPFNMVMQLLGSHDWVDKHGHLTPEQPMGDDIVRRYQPLATYFPFKHPMTTYLYYFIRDMLCVDPATRITAAKALHHGFLNKDLFTPRR